MDVGVPADHRPQALNPAPLADSGRGWREQRGATCALVGSDGDGHSASHRIRFAVNDIGGNPQSALFAEFHQGDHIGCRDLRVVRVIVDREGEHRSMTGHRLCLQWAAALAAFAGRRMDPVCAFIAVLDEQRGGRVG